LEGVVIAVEQAVLCQAADVVVGEFLVERAAGQGVAQRAVERVVGEGVEVLYIFQVFLH
jgi:hypothetical protein